MKRFFLIVVSILGISLLALNALVQLAEKQSSNRFTRQWLNKKLLRLNQLPIKTPLVDFCGASVTHFFFSGNDPRQLIVVDHKLDTQYNLMLPMPVNPHISRGFELVVDSPKIILLARNLSKIISYQLGDTILHITQLESPLFSRAAIISSQTIALRVFEKNRRKQVFGKADRNTGQIIDTIELFKDQKDKGFSTDGLLQYDTKTSRLIYVQFYQNVFYCLDSNLRQIYQGKTIDHTDTNLIQTRYFIDTTKKTGSLMPSVPLEPVNKNSWVNNGHLYVLSGLKADNEAMADFRENVVIDTYRINDGIYEGSFYIPDFKGEKVANFAVNKSLLIALYRGYIVSYQL